MHATPALRGHLREAEVQPIQDNVTLRKIDVTLRCTSTVGAVRLVPEGTALAFTTERDQVSLVAPEVKRHRMVELIYGK